MSWHWYRYSVRIVGRESGNRTPPLTFVRYRHHRDALEFCLRMNDAKNDYADGGLTYFEVVRLP